MGIGGLLEEFRSLNLLLEIGEEVSPDYETPWLAAKLARLTKKALLFEKVAGKEYSLATSVYYGKHELVLHSSFTEIVGRFRRLLQVFSASQPESISKITTLASLTWVADVFPRAAGSADFVRQSSFDVDLTSLPAVRHCEGEEYPVVKNPVVILRDPRLDSTTVFSEPIQIIDEKTALVHVPRGSRAYRLLEEAAKHGEALNIVVLIGAPPSLQLASRMDWVPWFDKFILAGVLSGTPLNLVKLENGVYSPVDTEIIIVGELVPGDVRPEGRMLYEDMRLYGGSPMPVIRVKSLLSRPSAVFYTSVTHPLVSDYTVLRRLEEKLALEYLRLLAPDIVDIEYLSYDAFRTLVVVLENPRAGRAIEIGNMIFSLNLNPYLDTVIVLRRDGVSMSEPTTAITSILSALQPENVFFVEGLEESLHPGRAKRVILDATGLQPGSIDYESAEPRTSGALNLYEKLLRELQGNWT